MKGIKFPLVIENGRVVETSFIDKTKPLGIKEQLLAVLNCKEGDRIFRGDFGLGIEMVFGNWEDKEEELKKTIANKLNLFVPEANISTESLTITIEGGMVNIFLAYEEPTNDTGVLI